jgi:hypothetical protein
LDEGIFELMSMEKDNFDKFPRVSKFDLRLGNIFEQGVVFKITGKSGGRIGLAGKGKLVFGKLVQYVDVGDLVPIKLTPEVLVEWCGFRNMDGNIFVSDSFSLIWSGSYFQYEGFLVLDYLHELQNLWYALNKQEIEIKG